MASISPNIFVRDINETNEFYKILGFDVAMKVSMYSPLPKMSKRINKKKDARIKR